MYISELVEKMDDEMYQAVKLAVELGKWPNGEKLNAEQKQMCMQALIIYENKNISPEQRTGFIQDQHCASQDKPASEIANDDDMPLKWQ